MIRSLLIIVFSLIFFQTSIGQSLLFEDFSEPDYRDTVGQYLGNDWEAQLWYWPVGESANSARFGASATYFGTTGGDPDVNGAGLFSGGIVTLPDMDPFAEIEYFVWLVHKDGGIWLQPFTIHTITLSGPVPHVVPTIEPEAIRVFMPEPSTFALLGFGSAALAIARRRCVRTVGSKLKSV